MSLELVTGYAGVAHVSSADMGAFNAGIVGTGRYVLPVGSQFEIGWSASSATLVINDGDAVDQGRHMRIPYGDTEIVTLSNGASGMMRSDIICLQYTLDATTGIESAAVVVLEGTPGPSYADPEIDYGDILGGDDHDLMPLYRVKINNYSIAGVEKLFTMYEGNGDLLDKVTNYDIITLTKTDDIASVESAWAMKRADGLVWLYIQATAAATVSSATAKLFSGLPKPRSYSRVAAQMGNTNASCRVGISTDGNLYNAYTQVSAISGQPLCVNGMYFAE